MFENIKIDFARSGRNKKALIVLSIYRTGNKLFYRTQTSILRDFLKILRILQFIFVEIPFGVEIPFKTKIGQGPIAME